MQGSLPADGACLLLGDTCHYSSCKWVTVSAPAALLITADVHLPTMHMQLNVFVAASSQQHAMLLTPLAEPVGRAQKANFAKFAANFQW